MSGPPGASRHGSPFDDLDAIRERLSGGPVLVALDFDGTLTEIHEDPAAPGLTAARRAILARLPGPGRRLAIVSGRALADVRALVAVPEAIYVGNHGLEIQGPGVDRHPPEEVAERLAALLERVADRLKDGPDGVQVEDKRWTATLHLRPRGDTRRHALVQDLLRDLVEEAGFVLRPGKASWEIRPADTSDKGDALRLLIDALPDGSAGRALYVGDDETDEDAFRALPDAVTARVGDRDVETAARYRLVDPAEVYGLLEALFTDYKPLSAYGAIGSLTTAALVGSDGSIDWCCLPELDSPSVFAAILDARQGGRWRIGPASGASGTQRYLDRTNVLETTFVEPTGTAGVIDFMPHWEGIAHGRDQMIVRIVEGQRGEVELEQEFAPSFDYARGPTRLELVDGGAIARQNGEFVRLWAPGPLSIEGHRAIARHVVREGDRLVYLLGHSGADGEVQPIDAFDAFSRTVAFWYEWVHDCNPDLCPFGAGPWHDMVVRSELVLKLLSHHETGGIAAALTTSLPEEIGGERNWDYRYAWIRDASFTVHALYHLGHHRMLHDFIGWIRDSALAGHPIRNLRVLYTLRGGAPPEERTLDHLEGYRGSRPVRVGNLAAEQRQLDIYGEILDATYQVWRYGVEEPSEDLAGFLASIADHVCEVWREPDFGMWEVRTEPRHFVHSKVMCWVALDRAVRLAESRDHPLAGDIARWREERQAIRSSILENGVDPERGTFVQSYGSQHLDAALLLIPILGFLPIDDPRVERTIAAIEDELVVGDLVIRYLSEDGLRGHEGAFAWCTFWLIDCLAMQGRLAEAEALLRKMIARANPVGLLSEEIHVRTGELLGNFPQAFTHLGVINSALFLNTMKGRVPEGPGAPT